MSNIYVSPEYKISRKQRRINFTNDRADFERHMSLHFCKAVEFYAAMRTEHGYSDKNLHAMFMGWIYKCDAQRNIIEFPWITPPRAKLRPNCSVRDIIRTTTIWWGDLEFKAPDRQQTGVSVGYVKVTGKQWPVAFDMNHGQVIYEDVPNGSPADYIDIVAVASFDMNKDEYKTTQQECANFALSLLGDKYVHVKTHVSLKPHDEMDGPVRAELIRLTITHDEFLKDQTRWAE
jgi:hypothetical protein